jgi:hypothetical protein
MVSRGELTLNDKGLIPAGTKKVVAKRRGRPCKWNF